MSLKDNIVKYLKDDKYVPLSKEELAIDFGIEIEQYRMFFNTLKAMEKEGLLFINTDGKYLLGNDNSKLITGTLQGSSAGFCYLIPNDKAIDDVYLSSDNLNGAIHKDKVAVEIVKKKEVGRNSEGRVVKIIEHSSDKIVGTFCISNGYGFVTPDDKRYGFDIFISKGNKNNAKNNDKVIVKIDRSKNNGKNPEGVVLESIGNKNDKGVDITSIAKQFDIPDVFPPKVLERAKEIEQGVTKRDISDREDFRSLLTVTIDGAGAKDFDDAISIEKDGDSYVLYVHIADVTHYVLKGSALDKEALRRGNSVYLLDRVIPMLPKELSNGICSLNPKVDRLTLTVKMKINEKGKAVDYKFYESVINSNYRLVYEDVSDLLEGNKDVYGDSVLSENLKLMEQLYKILNIKREKRGSIDFNFPEPLIILDENGKAIDVQKEDRRVANRIIEEFMIITNETVGSHFGFIEEPFIYRVHEAPDDEKIEKFKKIIHNFGYSLKGKKLYSKDFQKLINEVKGKPEERLVSTLLLRSLRKAEYKREPEIHFGLANMFYSHFTSPIRRYPDLFIHRIVKNSIRNKPNTKNIKAYIKMIDEVAYQCSVTERKADEAERDVQNMKIAEYMEDHIGDIYHGMIVSLTKFGMFVQLPNTVEGMVSFNTLKDDYYQFDEDKYIVIGERTNKQFRMGQNVTVKVVSANSVKREIDFEIVDGD